MNKILRLLVAIVYLEFIFHIKFEKLGSSEVSFFTFVEGKHIKNEEIQKADIYYAELSDDMGTRLYQILNRNFQYHRYTLDNVSKKKKRDEEILEDDIDSSDEISDLEIDIDSNVYTPAILFSLTKKTTTKATTKATTKTTTKTTTKATTKTTKITKTSSIAKHTETKNVTVISKTIKITKASSNTISATQTSSLATKINTTQTSFSTSSTTKINTVPTSSPYKKTPSSFYHGINIDNEKIFFPNNDVNTSKPFDYKVECKDEKKICDFINEKLEYAGNHISNIFNIYRTINVDVHILPFCKYMGGDNCNNLAALTESPSFVTLNITGHGLFSYPQALVKQLNIGSIVKKFKSYDISLYFNTDYLNDNDYGNYLLITTHELIHGMGFFHLMTTANFAFDMSFSEDRIIPQPRVDTYRTNRGEEKSLNGWIPFTVFDRYIVEINNPSVYIYKGISEYLEDVQTHKYTSKEKLAEHFDHLDISLDTEVYSKHLVSAFTNKKALGFKAYDGEIITLQTFKEYEPQSSVSHIHSPFSCDSSFDCYVPKEKLKDVDENYLMYYTIITRSINELVKRYSKDCKYGFIGKKIVKILKTMGWTEKNDMTQFKTYEDDILSHEALTFRSSNTTNSSSSSLSYKNTFIFIMVYLIFTLF